jgi:hypothetical protein
MIPRVGVLFHALGDNGLCTSPPANASAAAITVNPPLTPRRPVAGRLRWLRR